MTSDDSRPNILLICGEDNGRYFSCYGDPVAKTPNLDRLASQGCTFDNAYSTYPVCAPARCTIITGQYPMKIGSHQMRSTLVDPPRLFTHELQDAGYFVDWFSKTDFNFKPPDDWVDTTDDWRPRMAAGDMPDTPWMAFINFHITHESSIWPDEHPDPDCPGSLRSGRNGNPGVHVPQVTDPADVPVPAYLPDTPTVRRDIAQHYDNLHHMDNQIGEVLDLLDESGQADDTVVMFLSDHGRGLPREKRWPYTAGLQMPLIVRWPGQIEPGTRDDQLVSWVDIAPTILAITQTPIPTDYDGQVFLTDAAEPEREFVFGGRDRMDESFDMVRICRSKQYHYVRNFYPEVPYSQRNKYMEYCMTMKELRTLQAAGELTGDAAIFMQYPKPAEELYDIVADPDCVHNLAGDPAHADALAQHSAALDAFIEQVQDKGLVPERQLVADGMITDRIEEYRSRLAPLPAEHQVGMTMPVFEPDDIPGALKQ